MKNLSSLALGAGGTLWEREPLAGVGDPPVTDLPPLATDGMPPMVLREILSSILAWETPTPLPSEFLFEWSPSTAQHNLQVLRRYQMDLDAAIWAQPFSGITPGSEF